MSNVIALNGGEIPDTREPRESVIQSLEMALEAARAGDIQAIGLVSMHADGLSSHTIAGVGGSYGLAGAASVLLHKLTVMAAEE